MTITPLSNTVKQGLGEKEHPLHMLKGILLIRSQYILSVKTDLSDNKKIIKNIETIMQNSTKCQKILLLLNFYFSTHSCKLERLSLQYSTLSINKGS